MLIFAWLSVCCKTSGDLTVTLFLSLKEQGKTILLASHNREDIQVLCDEVYEMDKGNLRKSNPSG